MQKGKKGGAPCPERWRAGSGKTEVGGKGAKANASARFRPGGKKKACAFGCYYLRERKDGAREPGNCGAAERKGIGDAQSLSLQTEEKKKSLIEEPRLN